MILGFLGFTVRQPDQGGRVAAAGIPGRRLGRAVHTQPRRHRRRAEADRRGRVRLADRRARARPRPATCTSPRASARFVRHAPTAAGADSPPRSAVGRQISAAAAARRHRRNDRRRSGRAWSAKSRASTVGLSRSKSSGTRPTRSAIRPKSIGNMRPSWSPPCRGPSSTRPTSRTGPGP